MSMILKTLPEVRNHADLFFGYKDDDEFIGVINLDKSDLDFDTVKSSKADIEHFFNSGIDLEVDWKNLNHQTEEYRNYQHSLENYVKAVWLTYDYIKNGGFKNPIGAHWNPRENVWNIHPGGSRQKILYFFNDGAIKVLGFNTGGKSVTFLKIFNNIQQLKDYYNTSDIHLVIVADHGSLIPHIHFDQSMILRRVEDTCSEIKNFYKSIIIKTNFDIESWGYKPPLNGQKITVTLDNPESVDNIIRAFYLIPKFQNFNRYGVKIERT